MTALDAIPRRLRQRRQPLSPFAALGDFTTSPRMVALSGLSLVLGAASALLAFVLLRLISFFTNLFFLQRLSFHEVHLAEHDLMPAVLVAPVLGGLVIGVMARFGSEKIRGHGIPEAIEAILMNQSQVEPKVAVLKPLSSAISIGSGGPFGAEGPIIMTGGAAGSLFAGLFHLSSAERKTLLVAGAAGGMSATFGTPVAAVLLAVELLLFEWKPRSLVPVGIASATAALLRHYLLGDGPIFAVPEHAAFVGPGGFAACAAVGLSAGVLSMALTAAVYASEDAFHRLPIHWMWWPAIGGLFISAGGLVFPRALGVGYDTIGDLLQGDATNQIILGVLLVKSTMWAISLGSGTSGGVLAPLLMMGGALGGLEAHILPDEGAGFWPLIAMAAMLGGTMRSPLTGVVFAVELTQDVTSLLPLLTAVLCAHAFTVLVLRRSILTEKLSRRGFHLGREYSVDPLELALVRQVMRTTFASLPGTLEPRAEEPAIGAALASGQRLFPVTGEDGQMAGVISRSQLLEAARDEPGQPLAVLANRDPVVAFPGEPLRVIAYRMAETGYTCMPVVDPHDHAHVVGMVALTDLLTARRRAYDEEHLRLRRMPWARAPVRSDA